MTRISDLGLQQLLLGGFQGTRGTAETTQTQIASGNRAEDYSRLGRDSVNLVSAEGLVAQIDSFTENTSAVAARFDLQEINLQSINDQITSLRRDVVVALSNQQTTGLVVRIEETERAIIDAFNAKSGEQFIFGGVTNDQPPITVTDEGALRINNGVPTSIQIDGNTRIDGGLVAGDIAPGIIATLNDVQTILQSGSNNNLAGTLSGLDRVLSTLNNALAQTGQAQQAVEAAISRNARARDLAEIVASDLEDVDIAEALSRLSQDQLAINASAQALSIATQTSILNFI